MTSGFADWRWVWGLAFNDRCALSSSLGHPLVGWTRMMASQNTAAVDFQPINPVTALVGYRPAAALCWLQHPLVCLLATPVPFDHCTPQLQLPCRSRVLDCALLCCSFAVCGRCLTFTIICRRWRWLTCNEKLRGTIIHAKWHLCKVLRALYARHFSV